jgi:hypothetical protein
MTDRLTLFDVCRCGHRRLEHDASGCAACEHDLALHETFLQVPATAHLEAELPAPTVCRTFVAIPIARGRREVSDSDRDPTA